MRRAITAEAIGTSLLLYLIVGSGIAAETLGDDAVAQLLAHSVSVGLGLGVLVSMFQTVSGSHFNPSVTIALWRVGDVDRRTGVRYLVAQVLGALGGVVLANVSFGLPTVSISGTARDGAGLLVAEGAATFGLVFVILALLRTGRATHVPAAVGAWVASIVFATSSTGFANPAVTVGRILTDSYTGIAPASVLGFLAVQLIAGVAAAPMAHYLFPDRARSISPS